MFISWASFRNGTIEEKKESGSDRDRLASSMPKHSDTVADFKVIIHLPDKSNMGLRMVKPTICICKNKDADQLCSNCTVDQRLCFHHTDSIIPLLLISKVSSF